MNGEEKLEIWKRKKIEIEGKIREIGSYRDILLNLLNEVRANKNVKLNNSLKELDLEEEASHIKEWIEFHNKEVLAYGDKIKILEKEVSEQKSEAAKEEAGLKESLEEIEKEEIEYENKQLHEAGEEAKEGPDGEILKHELEDLEKESKEIREKEKWPEHKDEIEKTPEIEIPSKEEIEGGWEKEQFEKEAEEMESEDKEVAKSTETEKSEEKEKEIEKPGIGVKEKKEAEAEEKQQEATKEASKIEGFLLVKEKDIGEQGGKEEHKVEVKEEGTREQIKELFKERKSKLKERLALLKESIRDAFRGKKIHTKESVKYIIPIILLLLVTSVLFMSKPEITGHVTLTREKTHEDNLNLIINESGNYTWAIGNIGDIESIKASGRVKGNGTARVYIEKDGKKYLIFDNRNPNDLR